MSKLREWREAQGYTRQELADILDSDPASVFRWELAFDHPDRRTPHDGVKIKLFILSRGFVDANSFVNYPPLGQQNLPLGEAREAPLLGQADDRS